VFKIKKRGGCTTPELQMGKLASPSHPILKVIGSYDIKVTNMNYKITNKHHLEFLKELEKHAGQGTKYQKERDKAYIGTKKFSYTIKTPIKKQIVKDWIKRHPKLSISDYIELLNSLYSGQSHDERSIAGKLLEFLPKLRKQLNPLLLKKWLSGAEGWAEVDSICQSNFSAEEMLSNWNVWKKMIAEFSSNKNIHKKRAGLVLLTKPIRESTDPRLSKLAFANIKRLKRENDILITKAVSWLLRNLIKNHREEVKRYIKENKNNLPKIAIRETTRKLLTGRK